MGNKQIAVIFDMDGVLVDNSAFHQAAWEEFCRRHEVSHRFDHAAMFGKTNSDHLHQFFDHPLSNEDLMRLSNEKEVLYQEMYTPAIQPLPGLIPFMVSLDQEGIWMALATSGPAVNVRFVIDKLDIGRFMKVRIDDTMVTHGKPHPEVYLKAAEGLNVPPFCCLVMEDSVHGIESAMRAGMKVVGINTGRNRERLKKALLVVENFTELNVEIVKRLIIGKSEE